MAIDLAPETQRRLAERMVLRGYATEDELIRQLLAETADETNGHAPGTLAAIAQGVAEADRGEVAAWNPDEVRRELARRRQETAVAGTASLPAIGA